MKSSQNGFKMESRNRKEKGSSLTQILDKFHKIKESRFQGKEKVKNRKFGNSLLKGTNLLVQSDTQKSSSMHNLDKLDSENSTQTDRRMSLPSIFHPMQPLTINDPHSNETIERQLEKDIRLPVQEPRFSMSYVLQAYSRANVQEVEGKSPDQDYQNKVKDARYDPVTDYRISDGYSRKKHHHVHKDRDKPGHSHGKKRLHGYRKLPPLGLGDDDDNDDNRSQKSTERPRVFSL